MNDGDSGSPLHVVAPTKVVLLMQHTLVDPSRVVWAFRPFTGFMVSFNQLNRSSASLPPLLLGFMSHIGCEAKVSHIHSS
jgi:hypothetical protein